MLYFDFHTHKVSNDEHVVELVSAPEYPIGAIYWSVERHPWFAEQGGVHCDFAKSCAVGEVGLDRVRGGDMKLQIERLRPILAEAERLQKPVIFHVVRCFAELLKELKPCPKLRKVFHGFCGSQEFLEELWRHDFVVLLGEKALRGRKLNLQDAWGRIGLESDAGTLGIREIYELFIAQYGDIFNRDFAATFYKLFGESGKR